MIDTAQSYQRRDHVVERRIADEHILIPVRGDLADMQQVYVLNPVAAYLWEALDGSRPLDDIIEAMPEAFDVTAEVAREDALVFAGELLARGLIGLAD